MRKEQHQEGDFVKKFAIKIVQIVADFESCESVPGLKTCAYTDLYQEREAAGPLRQARVQRCKVHTST